MRTYALLYNAGDPQGVEEVLWQYFGDTYFFYYFFG